MILWFMCAFVLYFTESCTAEAAQTALRTLIDLGVSDSFWAHVSPNLSAKNYNSNNKRWNLRPTHFNTEAILKHPLGTCNCQITVNSQLRQHYLTLFLIKMMMNTSVKRKKITDVYLNQMSESIDTFLCVRAPSAYLCTCLKTADLIGVRLE